MLIKKSKFFLLAVVTAMMCLLNVSVWAGDVSVPVKQQICSSNDYALCSHAQCDCIDENGSPGPCVTGGLAQCKCPVVKSDSSNDDLQTQAYNNNFKRCRVDRL